jgi:hypothetical protein
MIVITSKREGFRRCGVAHAARPVEWPDSRWTGDELAVLIAEPMLTVEQVEDPAPAGDHGEGKLEMDPDQVPTALEPYEMEFDDPDQPPVAKKTGRKKNKAAVELEAVEPLS